MKKTPVYASVQRGTWNQSSGAVQHQVRSEGVRWGPKFAARSATFAPEAYSFDVSLLLILTGRSFAAICMLHFFLPSFSLADFKNRSKIFSAVDRDVTTFRFCFVFCLFVCLFFALKLMFRWLWYNASAHSFCPFVLWPSNEHACARFSW